MQKSGRNKKRHTTQNDLINLKLSIEDIRQQMEQDLNKIQKKIDSLLSTVDETRYQKLKNYIPNDWRIYLKSKRT